MRALIACVLLAACSPSIAPESYECGVEELCPDGEKCNGPDAICVTSAIAQPFACGTTTGDVEPNDSAATGSPALGTPECVSLPTELHGCVNGADSDDWFSVPVKSTCTNAQLEARFVFPIAFEPLTVEVTGADGATIATATDCPGTSDGFGDHALCVKAPVAPGATYAVHVARAGTANCGGDCSYNRYLATLQLAQGQ